MISDPCQKSVKPYHSLIVPMTRTAMGPPVIACQIKGVSTTTTLVAMMVVFEVVLTLLR